MVPTEEDAKLLSAGFFTLQHTVTFLDKGETLLLCKQSYPDLGDCHSLLLSYQTSSI